MVYRVYADGRPDELVRGADIVGTPLASFSKILATSRPDRGLQRLLRRRIGQRAGLGGRAGDPGFGDRDREDGRSRRTVRRCCRCPPRRRRGGGEVKRRAIAVRRDCCRAARSLRAAGGGARMTT